MNIHKTKIEWCSHTWNPVTGCRHDCPYCYARRIATRFGPKIDEFPVSYTHLTLPTNSRV